MERRRRLSDGKRAASGSSNRSASIERAAASSSMDGLKIDDSAQDGEVPLDNDMDGSGDARSTRSSSGSARSSKIAEQVVTGTVPNQKSPFRLWKSDMGKQTYDKSRPS